MLQHYFSWFLKNISCRGSHRKQITHRSYTQPIPSIRINGASPPLNGTRQNTTEPTGQLNGDISRNKYQAYSPTGKPSLPLPLLLCKKGLSCLSNTLHGALKCYCVHTQNTRIKFRLWGTPHQCSHEQNHIWQGSDSFVVDEFRCLFYKEIKNNSVSARTLSLLLFLKIFY